MRQERAAGRAQLAAATANRVHGDFWRAQRRAVTPESAGGGMEPIAGAGRQVGPRQRRDADLSVLAPAAVYGAESAAGDSIEIGVVAPASCRLSRGRLALAWRRDAAATAAGTAALQDLADFLSDHFRLREQVQVVRPAGFGIRARHVETAEGMRAHHRSGALAVDVEVADVELANGAVNFVARLGVDGASQAELGIVGNFERVIEAVGFDHGEYGAEDFFLL